MSFAREQRSAGFQAIGAGRSQAPRKATLIRPLARGLSVDSANCRGGVDLTNRLVSSPIRPYGRPKSRLERQSEGERSTRLRKASEFTVRRCHLAFTARTSNAVRCNAPGDRLENRAYPICRGRGIFLAGGALRSTQTRRPDVRPPSYR